MAAPPRSYGRRTDRVLSDLVSAARVSLGETLDAIVLYGSAAEGRLRASFRRQRDLRARAVRAGARGCAWRFGPPRAGGDSIGADVPAREEMPARQPRSA